MPRQVRAALELIQRDIAAAIECYERGEGDDTVEWLDTAKVHIQHAEQFAMIEGLK